MATLGGSLLNLSDIAKRSDPNGMPAKIAEVLGQSNPILQDVPWQASNLPTGHRSSIRTGLPSVSLRRLNEGVASSKGTVAQITDSMSLLETWSTCDKKLLDLQPGNAEGVRMSEATGFVEAMGQKAAELLIYGDAAEDDKEFNGLDPRYTSLTGNIADNMLSAGGSGSDNTSIWLVGWGGDKVFGIYPQGSVAGLQHVDHGLQVVHDSNNTVGGLKLAAYEDQYTWDMGLVVKDWRYVARICNIDVSDMKTLANEQELTDYANNIQYQMTRATHRIPSLTACNPVFYCTRTTLESFDVMSQALSNANVFATKDVNGETVQTFRGIPIKACDQILHTEAAIS